MSLGLVFFPIDSFSNSLLHNQRFIISATLSKLYTSATTAESPIKPQSGVTQNTNYYNYFHHRTDHEFAFAKTNPNERTHTVM